MPYTNTDFYITKLVLCGGLSLVAFYAVGFIGGYVQGADNDSSTLLSLPFMLVAVSVLYIFGWKAAYWFIGLLGEFRVNSILETMRDDGFDSIWGASLPDQKADIDHIAVGRTGVFVIETKNSDGTFEYIGDKLICNGRPYRGNVLGSAYSKSKSVQLYLTKHNVNVSVHPVVVFAGNYAKVRFGLHTIRGVSVIGYSWVSKLLKSGPSVLNETEIKSIATILKSLKHRR